MRRLKLGVAVVLAALVLLPTSPAAASPAGSAMSTVAASGDHRRQTLWAGTTVPVPLGVAAFVYDTELVPAGAKINVLTMSKRRTETWLAVSGLRPNRVYGAHLHVNPCGLLPTAAGPHYQRVADPVQPSTDPAYANPRNEVWLDLRTDARGAAFTTSTNRWSYRRTPPASLVLHAMGTATHAGHAGTAGARIACLTLTPQR